MSWLDFLEPTLSFGSSVYGAYSANKAARGAAREQMDFQERMSNTAYQRALLDMRESGLNPSLAYQQGGASSQPGAAAPVQNLLSEFLNGLSHSARNSIARRNLKLSEARSVLELENLSAQADLTRSNSALSIVNARKGGLQAAIHGRGGAIVDSTFNRLSNTAKSLSSKIRNRK